MNQGKAVGIQYAALPFRIRRGQVQILLITSRGTQRWIIPKGWPMSGRRPQDAAALEAAEEAGLIGQIEEGPIGSYRYEKRLKGEATMVVQVIVFPFRVEAQAEAWKEQGQRRFAWFRCRRAAALVGEPALRRIIRDFGAHRAPGLLARSLRGYRAWRVRARG